MKIFIYLFVLQFYISTGVEAQNRQEKIVIPENTPIDGDEIFTVPEETPVSDTSVHLVVSEQAQFIGNINKFISDSLVYPKEALKSGIQGKVALSFII